MVRGTLLRDSLDTNSGEEYLAVVKSTSPLDFSKIHWGKAEGEIDVYLFALSFAFQRIQVSEFRLLNLRGTSMYLLHIVVVIYRS